jgi:dihydroxyacetone kinase-like predicted kinase
MGTDKVIFLPNNPNIFLAARQAKRLTGRKMYIVPSKTIPQGISALLALNLEESVEYNLKRAGKAIRSVKTAEVTFAARDGKFGKHTFRQGDIIGLIDGKVDIVGQDPEEVLKDLMAHMVTESDSLITVYYGHDVDDETASVVYEVLEKDFGSDCDIEVHFGGQPLYYYIVSVE